MDQLIDRLRTAMLNYSSDQLVTPARAGFHYEQPQTGLVEWMPIYRQGEEVVIKVVGYHPKNPSHFQLPTIISSISAYDTQTGHLIGLMDGVLPTALRTGAASAIASQYLAKPGADTLGIIGCGAQAVTQIHAISRLFPIREIYYYDVDPLATHSLSSRCEMLGLTIKFIPATIEEVVANADILVTATSIDVGAGPLFDNLPVRDHLHINAIGSDFPGKTELPLSLLESSVVIPDFTAQAIVEGECQQLKEQHIAAEIVDVVQKPISYEAARMQITVYDSTGWALQDMVTFGLYYELAEKLGMGEKMRIEDLAGDAANPYDFVRSSVSVTV